MMEEVDAHESRNHWSLMRRSSLPLGTKTIMSIWSCKIKRFPDGRIMKYKARLCDHGGCRNGELIIGKRIPKLTKGLKQRDFFPSEIDPCVYYKDNYIFLVYVDDCIIFSKDKSVIDDLIHSLMNGPENYVLTDEGEINTYLGVDIDKSKKGSIELRQPYLIQRCLEAMEVNDKMDIKRTPATKPLLHKDKDGSPRKHHWNYRQVIGMLNYLKKHDTSRHFYGNTPMRSIL